MTEGAGVALVGWMGPGENENEIENEKVREADRQTARERAEVTFDN